MCLFLRNVLIFESRAYFWSFGGKNTFCGREDLFLFWFLPIFNGKTKLCESEDLFFVLHRFLAEKRDSVKVKTFILLVFNDFLWFHNEKLLTFW